MGGRRGGGDAPLRKRLIAHLAGVDVFVGWAVFLLGGVKREGKGRGKGGGGDGGERGKG